MTFKDWRRANGITQLEAAERFDVTLTTVSKWERGVVAPSPRVIRRFLAEGFTENEVFEMFFKDRYGKQ